MRQIGSLTDEQDAKNLADYLASQGILSHAEHEGENWSIWVREENQVAAARDIMTEFLQNPRDAKYAGVATTARRARQEHQRGQRATNIIDVRRQWNAPLQRRAPLIYTIILLCVAVSIASRFGSDERSTAYTALAFCDSVVYDATHDGLAQIKQGQLWRLITPIFLHGDLVHLLLNLSCIYYFGPQLESRLGSLRLAGMLAFIAVISNVCQYTFGGSPHFLGVSGVVFGMVGYMWSYSSRWPRRSYYLSSGTVTMFLAVLVIGFLGETVAAASQTLANWAHLSGFAIGIALAWWPGPDRG